MNKLNRFTATILAFILLVCNIPFAAAQTQSDATFLSVRNFEIDDTAAQPANNSAFTDTQTVDSGTSFGKWVRVHNNNAISNPAGSTITVPFQNGGLDMTSAEEVWIYMDTTELTDNKIGVKFTFSEYITNRKWQFGLREGCGVLINDNGSWVLAKADSNNTVYIPADYQGYVRIPIDDASVVKMTRATAYTISKQAVSSMEIGVNIQPSSYGSVIYFDNIGLVGQKLNARPLPAPVLKGETPVFENAPTKITVKKNSSSEVLDFSAGSTDDYYRYYCSQKPEHGTLSISPFTGVAYYIPDEDYSGNDLFSVTVINESFERVCVDCSVTVTDESAEQKEPAAATVLDGNSSETAGNIPNPIEDRLTSFVSDMGLGGYIDDRLKGNIENWLLTVQDDYPQLIDLIDKNNVDGALDIKAILFAENYGIFDYGICDYSSSLGRAISLTHNLTVPDYSTIGFSFLVDNTAVTDISIADALWMYIDISEYGTEDVPIDFGFLDVLSSSDGSYGSGETTTWGLKNGAKITLYPEGEKEKNIVTAQSYSNNKVQAVLPQGFKGWVQFPLNTDTFTRESYSKTAPETITGTLVYNYQLTLTGNDSTIGKTAYVASFGISSITGKTTLTVGNNETYKFTETFSADRFSTTANKVDDYQIFPWYGEFAGKILTGMSYMYRVDKDERLYNASTRFADALLNAQNDDGYIGIYNGIGVMGGEGNTWDVWNHYHAIYGLYQWYLVTGNSKYLNGALKAADFVYDWFSGSSKEYSSAGSESMNLAISHAFAILYKETGDEKYLNAAKSIVLNEWPQSGDWMNSILSGNEYYESALPRWECLHSIMTLGILYEITGEQIYYNAITEIFWSIVKTDRHNTGGFSSGEQASGDPFASGAIETCCTVAYMALGTEVLQLSADSSVADELELTYLNAMLGSLMQDDELATYNTPMDGQRVPGHTIVSGTADYPSVMCCQANLSRGLGELSQWALLTGKNGLYLNYYGQSSIVSETPLGNKITVSQQTGYPVDGKIEITLDMEENESFELNLRIPSWASGASVTFGGERFDAVSGEYYCLKADFKDGDVIEIDMTVPVHYWLGENSCSSKSSVYYGPVLLTLDENFSVGSVTANSVFTSEDIALGKAVSGEKSGCMLFFDTTDSSGSPIRLVDFSSAGKNSAEYYSWVLLSHEMEYIDFAASGDPVWNNSENKQPAIVLGDVDDSGNITASDALTVLQIAVGKITPTDRQKLASDVNKNGTVAADDALRVLQYAVKKITSFD